MIYDFKTQLSQGKQIEISLDKFFSKWYNISPVDIETEKQQGIDRIFTSESSGKNLRVEYKADFKTAQTGNIFIELSVDGDNGYHKDGWALHSNADLILYVIVYIEQYAILAIEPPTIRKCVPKWEQSYRKVKCQNVGYHSVGLLVPAQEVAQISYKKFVLDVVA